MIIVLTLLVNTFCALLVDIVWKCRIDCLTNGVAADPVVTRAKLLEALLESSSTAPRSPSVVAGISLRWDTRTRALQIEDR